MGFELEVDSIGRKSPLSSHLVPPSGLKCSIIATTPVATLDQKVTLSNDMEKQDPGSAISWSCQTVLHFLTLELF